MKFAMLVLVAGVVGMFASGQGAVLDNGYMVVRDEVLVAFQGVSHLMKQAGGQVAAVLQL